MEHLHYKLYKPYGMLSQMLSRDPKEQKKRFLGELWDFVPGTMPVGRLDERSEGLLLMTTDGGLSDRINRLGVEKEYYAQLDGLITQKALDQIRKGVEIGISGKKYSTLPCRALLLTQPPSLPEPDPSLRIGRHRPDSWISLTLSEGKFRQVRKMTAAVGFPTLRLVRVRVGSIELGNLAPGEVRRLEKLTP